MVAWARRVPRLCPPYGVLISLQPPQHILQLLLVGGFDTTANMIALGTLTLLKHPDQLAKLREDPTLVPNAVEELLRYLSVAHQVAFRLATADVQLRSACIHAGDGVIAPIAAANRDPEVFEDPDTFDPRREQPLRADQPLRAEQPRREPRGEAVREREQYSSNPAPFRRHG